MYMYICLYIESNVPSRLCGIKKHTYNVPVGPFISNCGYYTENISSFMDFLLQSIAKKVKSYVKDTNDFLKKLRSLKNLPSNSLLCTMDVVGLYPNIPHYEGLSALRKDLMKEIRKMYLLTLLLNWQN